MCIHITQKYLREHSNEIFVFGDNILRKGHGGAASLRDEPNTYGFITKKAPNNLDIAFYTPIEYIPIWESELSRLICHIVNNNHKIYLISKIGAGLANKYKIFDCIIEPNIKQILSSYKNVKFLW